MTANVPWILGVIMVPMLGALAAHLSGRRFGPYAALLATVGVAGTLTGLVQQVTRHGAVRYRLGGWGAPLGIELYADGLSLVMLLSVVVVGTGITFYSRAYFGSERHPDSSGTANASETFWPVWMLAWGALNALFLSGDVFNLYVTLELVTLASVALIGLARQPAAAIAALRYLLAAVVGSLFYLFGTALLYSEYGTLDSQLLSSVVRSSPATSWALALMSLGLAIKTAVFPLYFWLPPAHGNALAPVSALLSALVVKASFYVMLRLWLLVFVHIDTVRAGLLLSGLGAAGIFYGSLQALRQQRLKMLIAYSTVAQVGYLLLAFAFLDNPAIAAQAWRGTVYYALSHACAKAAMFLAAGAMIRATGDDQLDELNGIGRHVPMSVFAFGLGGVNLMGLPPSGGFIGKWLLLRAAIDGEQWWLTAIVLGGGLLAAAYVFPVLSRALFSVRRPRDFCAVPRVMEFTTLALALFAVMLGLLARLPLDLLEIGAPLDATALEAHAP